MSFTMPVETLLVGRLACFAQIIPALHAAHVRDVDAMVDMFDSALDAAFSTTLVELTSPSDVACLTATMRELRDIRERLRAVRRKDDRSSFPK